MKTKSSLRSILFVASACCALAAPHFAFAQPEAPVAADAATPTKPRKGNKTNGEKNRDKKLSPRVIAATETAIGKPLTPEQTAQLTTALHEREAAVKAANDAYYAAFAQTTGLTPEQAKEIDKPARNGAKATTPPKNDAPAPIAPQ